MQLSDVRTHILDLVGQDVTVSQDAFGTDFLNRVINRQWRRLYSRVADLAPEEITKTGTFSTVKDTREYNLLTINSNAMSDFDTLQELERSIVSTDEPVSVAVDRVFNRGRTDIPNRAYLRGTATLGFYGTPQSASTFTVHYAPRWTDLVADTDDPAITATLDPILRESFQDQVIYRAAAMLLLSENGPSAQAFMQLAQEDEQALVTTLRKRRPGSKTMQATSRVTGGSRGGHRRRRW